jgi:hypothetical protein
MRRSMLALIDKGDAHGAEVPKADIRTAATH